MRRGFFDELLGLGDGSTHASGTRGEDDLGPSLNEESLRTSFYPEKTPRLSACSDDSPIG